MGPSEHPGWDHVPAEEEAGQDGRRGAAEGGGGGWEGPPEGRGREGRPASRERRGGPVGPLGLGESGFAGLGLGRIEIGRPRGEPT